MTHRKRSAPMLLAAGLAGALYVFGASEAVAPERDRDAIASCLPSGAPAAEEHPAQRVLVEHLSRRFQIAGEAADRMVEAAYRAADDVGLDPLLVLAVISVESRFNPIAESAMGAKGLMQIIPRFHLEKLREFGGIQAVLDPESNILVGARILQEYVHRTGSLIAGLQYYNGAFSDPSAQYAEKVMAERRRLEVAVRAALGERASRERTAALSSNPTGS